MNRERARVSRLRPRLIPAAAALGFTACSLLAQPVQHLTVTEPGGMPGLPVMMGIERVTNGVHLSWDGPSGYYQVYQKSNRLSAPWLAVGRATNLMLNVTITTLYSNAFFRVSGPSPQYVGAKACTGCHDNIHNPEVLTPHAGAFTNAYFVAAGGQTNSSCLPCHTVGYGLPTGFGITNKNGILTYTKNLAGVQCENCHGPAANHAANPDDFSVVPRVDIAATVCGGCHTGPMQPTYEEWNTSEHATVTPDVLQSMTASTNSISSCGRCHSGSVRLALINGQNPLALTNDLNVAITCAVCHDPHQTNANPVQLYNPVFSTNNYSLATSDVFATKYAANTNINICGQCHNARGAAWTDTSLAPHHSQQYNQLIGSVGELVDGPATFLPGPHTGLPSSAFYSTNGTFYLTNQCVSCHMQPDAPPANLPSHTFAVDSHAVCMNCHLIEPGSWSTSISNKVTTLIVLLNNWAALKAPPQLQTNGVVAWEYTTPGGLVLQTNSLGYATGWSEVDPVNYSGPNADGQALLTTNYPNILKARFDLYLVVNDGTVGLHNPIFANQLLIAAQYFVQQELLR